MTNQPLKSCNQLWFRDEIQRYQHAFLNLNQKSSSNPKTRIKQDILSNWFRLEKIHLHVTSGMLIASPGLCLTFDYALETISCMHGSKVVCKKANANFKLAKNTLLGIKNTLRRDQMHEFFYKWYFNSCSSTWANNDKKGIHDQSKNHCVAVNNIFLFHELDRLDYDLFSKMHGFEIVFKSN